MLTQKVYFDFDRDVLRDDARAMLDAKVPILVANPGVTVAITGHTDERGTAEYNLALGQRRAAQVKRYLTSKGIDDARLTTQSLGDSQPAVQGTDESAYQQNRRAEFQPRGAQQPGAHRGRDAHPLPRAVRRAGRRRLPGVEDATSHCSRPICRRCAPSRRAATAHAARRSSRCWRRSSARTTRSAS